jgi:hypothetical protein
MTPSSPISYIALRLRRRLFDSSLLARPYELGVKTTSFPRHVFTMLAGRGQEEQQRCSEKKKGDVHRWRHIRTRAQHELVQNDPANKMTHRTKSTER